MSKLQPPARNLNPPTIKPASLAPARSGSGDAPLPRATHFPVERFDHRMGLKSLQIHCTLISKDGRIWCATPAGLACYDGVTIFMFDRRHGLSSHGLRTIALSADNALWLGTDIGIEVLDISALTPKVVWSEPIGTVNCLDISGDLAAIGTARGLFCYKKGDVLSRVEDNRLGQATITALLIEDNGDIWTVGPRHGVIVYSPRADTEDIQARVKTVGIPTTLARGRDGQIVVGGTQGLIYLKPDRSFAAKFQTGHVVRAILDYDGLIWVGSENYLHRLHFVDGEIQLYDLVHDAVTVSHLINDKFDNIWMSTGDQALLRISHLRNTFTSGFDSAVGSIMCIKAGDDGVYIGGANGLLDTNSAFSLKGLTVWDVHLDDFGKLWIATSEGLYCSVNPHFTIAYRHEDCDVAAAACRALASYNGDIYVSSIRGLAKITASGITEILSPEGASLGYVYSLHVGPQNRLWIATLGGGVYRLDGAALSKVDLESLGPSSNVYAITHNDSGNVFVAHDNLISTVFPDDGAEVLIEAEAAIAAWSLKCANPDLLIAGTSNGLIIYHSQTGAVRHKISGSFDDVPWEFTTSRSLDVTDDYQVYCGLGSGLRKVDLNALTQSADQPCAQFAYARWRGAEPDLSGEIPTLDTGKWHLEIGIKTGWYLDACTMRTRLKGFEADWSPIKPIGPILYTSLPAGRYALEVQVISPLAGPGPVETVYEVQVRQSV